jgi:UDP-N-acetylmuramate dehydrogenase
MQASCVSLIAMLIEENKALGPLTTFGIGGPSRWFVEAHSEAEIVEAAAWAKEHGAPIFVLGGGSNLLVSDEGFDGLVVRAALRGIEIVEERNGEVLYDAAAGEIWDDFVERTVRENCAGVECLAGVPGTVGGAPVQNIGAYGQEVAATIASVRAFDLERGEFVEFSCAECGFDYRRSRFNGDERGRYIVSHVRFRLTRDGEATVRYPDVQKALAECSEITLATVAEAVRQARRNKGMLSIEGDPDCCSAGSFFKNPVVNDTEVKRVAAIAGKEPPRFPAGPEKVKLSAAWLIEQAGFCKGYTLGAAAVSSRHTLALVNRGGATATEILTLAAKIAEAVEERFGVELEMEPVRLGFSMSVLG